MDAGYRLVESALREREQALSDLYAEIDKDKAELEQLNEVYREKVRMTEAMRGEIRAFQETLSLLEEAALRRRVF